MSLEKIRSLVRSYVDKHQYESALFWADKAETLSEGNIKDRYWLAQCMFLSGQYNRASHFILHSNLKYRKVFRYLAAQCLAAVKKWEEALNVVEGFLDNKKQVLNLPSINEKRLTEEELSENLPVENIDSSIALLQGKIYEALENRVQAVECYKDALKKDVQCYEAFDLLVKHQMLKAEEEKELLESLPFSKQLSEEDAIIIKCLYATVLKKYDKPSESSLPDELAPLKNNYDVITNQAERHYYNCNFRTCYKMTTDILQKDPLHTGCIPLHIATLVELKKPNELFYLAHKLVDQHPEQAVSWFAVGCYYYLVSKYEPSRRFLSKATSLDRLFGPAWLAFGHAFAAEGEHDQATAAYFTAARLMKGCHLPLLYNGLEHGLTRNFKLAEKFFIQALSIAPSDPFVLHEMGVVAFNNGDWEFASKHFSEALSTIQSNEAATMSEKWEPLLNNLGHVHRKMKKYEEALEYHRQALVLSPQNSSTFSAIAYIYALMGQFSQAIDYFHKALGVGNNDTFSSTVLGHTLELYIGEMSPCEGVQDSHPDLDAVVKEEVVATEKSTSSLDIEVEMEDND